MVRIPDGYWNSVIPHPDGNTEPPPTSFEHWLLTCVAA